MAPFIKHYLSAVVVVLILAAVVATPAMAGKKNDTLTFTRYNQPPLRTQVGLAMNFHDLTVRYDNFIFEEIEAAAQTP